MMLKPTVAFCSSISFAPKYSGLRFCAWISGFYDPATTECSSCEATCRWRPRTLLHLAQAKSRSPSTPSPYPHAEILLSMHPMCSMRGPPVCCFKFMTIITPCPQTHEINLFYSPNTRDSPCKIPTSTHSPIHSLLYHPITHLPPTQLPQHTPTTATQHPTPAATSQGLNFLISLASLSLGNSCSGTSRPKNAHKPSQPSSGLHSNHSLPRFLHSSRTHSLCTS